MEVLRCKYCGAPLDRGDVEADTPYVTCRSCGTTQQRIDAKAYLDQVMAQVRSWVSSAMPGGFSMTQVENVDSIARHNIFVTNVKPRVTAEMAEYRFAANALMSNPLFVLPFSVDGTAKPAHTPAAAFELDAKIKSLSPLAVDTTDRAEMAAAGNLARAYALIINNVNLMREDKPGRYVMMGNNFSQASEALAKASGYEQVSKRLGALADACKGCEKVLNGDPAGSVSHFDRGVAALRDVKSGIFSTPAVAVMLQGVEKELSQVGIAAEVARSAQATGMDALKAFSALSGITKIEYPNVSGWNILRSKGRNAEIFDLAIEAIKARSGEGTIPVAPGDGDVLYPFWDIDLRYSFTTGALWSKKSVEVREDILVPADFTVDRICLADPSSGLTDIFSPKVKKDLLGSLKGTEKSISAGEGIGLLSESARPNSPGGRRIIIPLSTKKEAEQLTENYLTQRESTHSKLKLTKPFVKQLIYVPCRVSGTSLVVGGFGSLLPQRVMRADVRELVIV
ncbi:MAG: hypothetical protein GX224_00960 [Thermoplasmatales archaeon]|nr:hypothetical protein [Thermoplasmatales archaeon]